MSVNIKSIRESVCKTQSKVAKDTGITIVYLSQIENGRVPGRKTMELLSCYFDKTIDELFYAN